MLIGFLGLLVLVSGYLAKLLSDEKTENAALRDRIASLKRQLARRRVPVGT
jgi:protein-arginine kinase activator protein McsA